MISKPRVSLCIHSNGTFVLVSVVLPEHLQTIDDEEDPKWARIGAWSSEDEECHYLAYVGLLEN
jgi:hypothetical protein